MNPTLPRNGVHSPLSAAKMPQLEDSSAKLFADRYERLKSLEGEKNSLIEELMFKLDALSEQYTTACFDRTREAHFNREVQRREDVLLKEREDWTAYARSNKYALVLIDGDGTIFQDHLLQKGEQGGREAAGLLSTAAREYLHRNLEDLPIHSEYKIVAKVFANMKGLGETCRKAGIVDRASKIDDFARGFTQSKPLFDFVDVGSGKERADNKVSGVLRTSTVLSTEVLRFYLNDCHCRQVMFGCSHDNGYARVLEDVQSDPSSLLRVSLLEGVPFEREIENLRLHFRATKFETLFRDRKINVEQYLQQQQTFQSLVAGARTVSPSAADSVSVNISTASIPQTWASAATALVGSPPTQAPAPSQAPLPAIMRNRNGERIDSEIKYDRFDVKRVKALKMCNVHFLRGECEYSTSCTHSHSYKPSKSELATLKYVVRLAPCRMGHDCDDPKCMYGHHCPSGDSCSMGENCRFSDEKHNIDMRAVRSIKV